MPSVTDVGGRPTKDRGVVVERAERGVMAVAGDPPEAALAAAFGGVTVAHGAAVAVVDHEQVAERLATDGTEPTLRPQSRVDLDSVESLP